MQNKQKKSGLQIIWQVMPYLLILASLHFTDNATAAERISGPIPASVTRVIDGDTVEVRARIWLGQDLLVKVRLAYIDAPEIRGRCPAEKHLAQQSKLALAALLQDRKVMLHDIHYGKYAGRVIARLTLPTDAINARADQDIGELMQFQGFAKLRSKASKSSWCEARARIE